MTCYLSLLCLSHHPVSKFPSFLGMLVILFWCSPVLEWPHFNQLHQHDLIAEESHFGVLSVKMIQRMNWEGCHNPTHNACCIFSVMSSCLSTAVASCWILSHPQGFPLTSARRRPSGNLHSIYLPSPHATHLHLSYQPILTPDWRLWNRHFWINLLFCFVFHASLMSSSSLLVLQSVAGPWLGLPPCTHSLDCGLRDPGLPHTSFPAPRSLLKGSLCQALWRTLPPELVPPQVSGSILCLWRNRLLSRTPSKCSHLGLRCSILRLENSLDQKCLQLIFFPLDFLFVLIFHF